RVLVTIVTPLGSASNDPFRMLWKIQAAAPKRTRPPTIACLARNGRLATWGIGSNGCGMCVVWRKLPYHRIGAIAAGVYRLAHPMLARCNCDAFAHPPARPALAPTLA